MSHDNTDAYIPVVLRMSKKQAAELGWEECVGNSVYFGSPFGDGWRFYVESIDGEEFVYGEENRKQWEARIKKAKNQEGNTQ